MKKIIAILGVISDYSLTISTMLTISAYFFSTSETIKLFFIPAVVCLTVSIASAIVSHIMAATLARRIEHDFIFDQMVRRSKRLSNEDVYIDECMREIHSAKARKADRS